MLKTRSEIRKVRQNQMLLKWYKTKHSYQLLEQGINQHYKATQVLKHKTISVCFKKFLRAAKNSLLEKWVQISNLESVCFESNLKNFEEL